MPSATSLLLACRPQTPFDSAEPGQFVHVDTGRERAFRRPFSVAGLTDDGAVELLIELRGEGTRTLAELPVGSSLAMMGPLGNGFRLPPAGSHAAVVAGGIGVAGVRHLVQRLESAGVDTTVYVGARTADALLHGVLPRPSDARVATDDGSAGMRGTVCDLFATGAGALAPDTTVYGCGPRPMLDTLAAVAARSHLACQVSLEEMMACGVGACRGCVVPTVDGYRTVCKDGPVFDASMLVAAERTMEVARG